MNIVHSEIGSKGLFLAKNGDKRLGQLSYSRASEELIIVDHTEAFEEGKGQGVAKALVFEMVDWARRNRQQVIPLCPFAKSIIERNAQLRDVIK